MDYFSVEQGRTMPGLKLVLTAGVPGPWGESAKAVLKAKGIAYVPVLQEMGTDNAPLVAWTGHRNAPIVVHDGEPPRTGWAEILMLAERLKPEPALVPADVGARADMLGLCQLICGERGLGWNRRLMMTGDLIRQVQAAGADEPPLVTLLRGYGYTDAEYAAAPGRVAALLRHLADRLRAQQERGSAYFLGDGLTALDLYWTCFSALLDPLPQDVNPMPDMVRWLYQNQNDVIAAAMDPILFAHRDRIYRENIGLPLDY